MSLKTPSLHLGEQYYCHKIHTYKICCMCSCSGVELMSVGQKRLLLFGSSAWLFFSSLCFTFKFDLSTKNGKPLPRAPFFLIEEYTTCFDMCWSKYSKELPLKMVSIPHRMQCFTNACEVSTCRYFNVYCRSSDDMIWTRDVSSEKKN